MGLQEFIFQHGNLANDTKTKVSKILKNAENQIIPLKTQQGRGRQMVPCFESSSDRELHGVSPRSTVMSLFFPYFSLETLRSVDLPEGSQDQPAMRLMQLYDSASKEGRDLQQAIALHDGSHGNICLHVSQLWCVVINQSKSVKERAEACQPCLPVQIFYLRAHNWGRLSYEGTSWT